MASMASCSLLDRLVWVSKDKAVEKYLLRPVYTGDFCRQLHAIFNFVAAKLHQVSNMFETPAISRRQIALKIAPGLHVRF